MSAIRTAVLVVASLLVVLLASTGCVLGPATDRSGPTACAADELESNNTRETARNLGDLRDDPDSSLRIKGTVHLGSDVDWYRVQIADTGGGGDPNIAVSVSQGFSVRTWFLCDRGRATETCLQGSTETMTIDGVEGCRGSVPEPATDESGNTVYPTDPVAASTTDCSGTSDENGTLLIEVERASSTSSVCSYDLSVFVD